MSNLETITKKIREAAQSEADALLAEAQTAADAYVAKERQRAEEAAARTIAHAEAEAPLIADRIRSGVARAARDQVLAARQKKIDEAFALAKAQLRDLDETTYQRVLDSFFEHIRTGGALGSEREADAFLLLELPEGRHYEAPEGVRVVTNPKLTGGFCLTRGGERLNCAFDAIVDALREEVEPEVAAMLVPSDSGGDL